MKKLVVLLLASSFLFAARFASAAADESQVPITIAVRVLEHGKVIRSSWMKTLDGQEVVVDHSVLTAVANGTMLKTGFHLNVTPHKQDHLFRLTMSFAQRDLVDKATAVVHTEEHAGEFFARNGEELEVPFGELGESMDLTTRPDSQYTLKFVVTAP